MHECALFMLSDEIVYLFGDDCNAHGHSTKLKNSITFGKTDQFS